MVEPRRRDLNDDTDQLWTLKQAAAHAGITIKTVERYIREGLPVYFKSIGGRVLRDEFLAERIRRAKNQRATRSKRTGA